jgi:hypothetical protein
VINIKIVSFTGKIFLIAPRYSNKLSVGPVVLNAKNSDPNKTNKNVTVSTKNPNILFVINLITPHSL